MKNIAIALTVLVLINAIMPASAQWGFRGPFGFRGGGLGWRGAGLGFGRGAVITEEIRGRRIIYWREDRITEN